MTFIVGSIRPLYVSSDSYTSYLTKIKLKKSIIERPFYRTFSEMMMAIIVTKTVRYTRLIA